MTLRSLIHTTALLLALPLLAHAQFHESEEGPPPSIDPSPANILSVEAHPSEAALLWQANHMPAVTIAAQNLASQGFVRVPLQDHAGSGLDEFGNQSYAAALSFQSPSDPSLFATLLVLTIRTPEGWTTRVDGGAYRYVEGEASYPPPTGSLDESVDIIDMSSTDPSNYAANRRTDGRRLFDFAVCTLGESFTFARVGALCGPYAPACATVGAIVAVIHCGLKISD